MNRRSDSLPIVQGVFSIWNGAVGLGNRTAKLLAVANGATSGKWQVASGKWQVASGKWQVASGKWQVASGCKIWVKWLLLGRAEARFCEEGYRRTYADMTS
ncbi:hypothetical protein [Tumebacillus algifaecis]|uniref:hypothetical protein n=1 Tax=Tumebacillus algifaecis TaxID=1214604 RepID=UPI0012FE7037|nr:hypothetical protein [Tumebacillus algifaecis]